MMKKILLIGDTHGNTAWAREMVALAQALKADAIVQLGDFGIWPGPGGDKFLRKLNKYLDEADLNLYFVDGNHEDFPKLEKLRGGQEGIAPLVLQGFEHPVPARIHHIPRGHVWEWGGVAFMGVGGAVSIDRQWRIPGKSWWPEETLTPAQEEYALEQAAQHIDVLVSHDCPTYVPMTGLVNDPNSHWHRQIITGIAKVAAPRLWFHGHMHHYMEYKFGYGDEETQVYGLDCDATRDSWAVLWLPEMRVKTAAHYEWEKKAY
jgi:Icc-related predicted phosphoesterase